MKTLFIGGIKSGKSSLAETYILQNSISKPIYLATTEFIDEEMKLRISSHKKRRKKNFITIEESLHLSKITAYQNSPILVECISMWINNMLYHDRSDDAIFEELHKVCTMPNDIVFVLNDVGQSVVSDNPLVRRFVDLSGIASQIIAQHCDAVFDVKAGISIQIN
jgi:adenosylcobinamide kinase / adenosylcobinamide-phosphate guanylyltransferase